MKPGASIRRLIRVFPVLCLCRFFGGVPVASAVLILSWTSCCAALHSVCVVHCAQADRLILPTSIFIVRESSDDVLWQMPQRSIVLVPNDSLGWLFWFLVQSRRGAPAFHGHSVKLTRGGMRKVHPIIPYMCVCVGFGIQSTLHPSHTQTPLTWCARARHRPSWLL